jgi:hypothetical protein
LPDVPENSGMVLTPTQQEMDQFEPYILQTYRNNWEERRFYCQATDKTET